MDKEPAPSTTQLVLPGELRERIMVQAEIDLRSMKAEILALLDEALKAREKRK